jgi:aspartate kinase
VLQTIAPTLSNRLTRQFNSHYMLASDASTAPLANHRRKVYPSSMDRLVVAKFGGTSMGDAQCMLRSAQVARDHGARLIVVSATSGTTNQLIQLAQRAETGDWDKAENSLREIEQRHTSIATELKLSPSGHDTLKNLFSELESLAKGVYFLRDASLRTLDSVMSMGERLSSVLFTQAAGPNSEWVDARDLIKTDSHFGKARPLLAETKSACKAQLNFFDNRIYVTQGFIGSTIDGHTTTLGRGGSDYSAALLAEATRAGTLEIWTDVPGVATTDPRICSDAKSIPEISFAEMSELATFGAKVLHPATLWPAIRSRIPVFVGSSFDPDQNGTWIKAEVSETPKVRALALRRRQVLVTVTTPEMLHAHGFLAKIFSVFDAHSVSIDAISTSEISVAMTLEDSTLLNKKLIEDLERFAEVRVEENLSLISLIGHNVNHTPGLAAQIFSTISDINVRMICQGASLRNLCFLVSEDRGEDVIRRLHAEFIE